MVSGLWEGQKSASLAQMKLLGLFLLMALPLMGSEWVELFDGKTLKGWNNQGDANWAVKNGEITADSGEVCLLTTSEKYKNYELVLEFKAAIGTNSGVFLNTEAKVKDEAVDCYEINIAPPSNPFPTGSIVKHHKIEKQGEKDAWRSYKLRVENGVITVTLDGKELVTYTAKKPRPEGYIGLQKNQGKIAFRNIRIRKL